MDIGNNFDVFLSYKTRRNIAEARKIKQALAALGYHVWFDKDVLNCKSGLGKHYTKEQLIDILTEAVKRCQCSIVFEAELEAVAITPDINIQEEYRKKTLMLTESGPIAWNWQKLEIGASSKSIAIHPSSNMIFVFDKGIEISHNIGLPREVYSNTSMLLQRTLQSLDYFGIVPLSQGTAKRKRSVCNAS